MIRLQEEHLLFFLGSFMSVMLICVKLEVFPYHLLDKSHWTQGCIFTHPSLLWFVLQRSELWDDTMQVGLLHLEGLGLGDRKHVHFPGYR